MLLSTFPTVTIFQNTFTGYQNETHIAAVRDDLPRLAPTAAETCFTSSWAIKCQCGNTANDTPCSAPDESSFQVCAVLLHQRISYYCFSAAAMGGL